MADVKPIPDDYPRVVPYLCVDGAAAAIDYYCSVLGAKERMRMPGPGDKIGHAELELGRSVIMLSDEEPEMDVRSPKAYGGSPVSIHVYVEDVDEVFQRAVQAGGQAESDPENKFYGDRSGTFRDPFGHIWHVSSHVEDVPHDEMERRAAEASGGG